MSERTLPDRHEELVPQGVGVVASEPIVLVPIAPDAPEDQVGPIVAGVGPGIVIDWEQARLKAIMPRVVSRAMSYSAMSCFDDALIASVQRFYGLDVDVATAETEVLEDDIERVRFFPWFLWDFMPPGHPGHEGTVGARLMAEGELAPIERRILGALCDTVVDFWEVKTVDARGIELVALGLGLVAYVEDEVLGKELSAGQILQGRIVLIPAETGPVVALIDAIYAVLPASTKSAIAAELDSVVGSAEVLPRATMIANMKQHAPELIDFAEYLLESSSEASAVANGDGETMVLCHTIVPRDHALALEAALLSGELGLEPSAAGDAWVASEGDKPVGFVCHDLVRGLWLVGAPSRERLARLTTRLRDAGLATADLHAEETLERAAEAWVEAGVAGPHLSLDPEVREAFEGWIGGRWIDTPNPGLGDTSPRQAARDEALRPALERLVARIEALVGKPIGRDLGL